MYLREQVDLIPTPTPDILYHVTNIKNYPEIQEYGLIPTFGETLKQAYGSYYIFDDTDAVDDEDDSPPIPIPFEGILFFSDTPKLHYSQPGLGRTQINWDDVVLCLVRKNDTIYHKVDDYPRFTNYQDEPVGSIDYTSVYDLPIFIETGDWFSLTDQECDAILVGDALQKFLHRYYPELLKTA
jgi:hypothetical protein